MILFVIVPAHAGNIYAKLHIWETINQAWGGQPFLRVIGINKHRSMNLLDLCLVLEGTSILLGFGQCGQQQAY